MIYAHTTDSNALCISSSSRSKLSLSGSSIAVVATFPSRKDAILTLIALHLRMRNSEVCMHTYMCMCVVFIMLFLIYTGQTDRHYLISSVDLLHIYYYNYF